MQSDTTHRVDIHATGLITFSGEKSSRSNNFSDEPLCSVDSTTFLYQLDESEVIRCCALLSYQLRLKHNVVYAFKPHEMNADQLNQFQLFNRISCFNDYVDLCKSFILSFRECSDAITARFSQESKLRDMAKKTRKRQSDGTLKSVDDGSTNLPDIDNSGMNDDEHDNEFRELKSVYEQIQNMRKMFDFYFNIFDGSEFDRYLIYEKLYIDTCLSAEVPLTMQLTDFTHISALFSSLMRLTLVSTDFSNTQFSAFFGTGLLLIMLLYLTSDEVLRDVNIVTSTDKDGSQPALDRSVRSHWTRLTLRNQEDRDAACLLRDTGSDAYRKAIAGLPAKEFDPLLGHVYMSKGDTLSTLFLQFNSRLFMRIYEWPERRDVKSHLIDKYICDNIASYFLKSGRGQQHGWIKFFKRKRNHGTATTILQNHHTDHDKSAGDGSIDGTSSFLLPTPKRVDSPDHCPQIFINIPALHSLYDSLAQSVSKNNSKRKRIESTQGTGDSPFSQYSGSAVISADSADVKRNWDALDKFKQSYVAFFVNGCVLRPHFREWYQQMCVAFILRSGGYRGFCHRGHARKIDFEADLSRVYLADCEECTASLYSDANVNNSVFSLEKWAKEVHTMLFPYNFLLISASFLKNNRTLCDNTLRDAWILKAQEILVSRKFSSDKCLKCHAYLCELEKRSRLIVEEGQLKHLFISAMEHLPFIRDLMNIDENEEDDNAESMDIE